MTNDRKVWRPRRQHRRHIYYKVQVFDDLSLTWLDEKNAFDDLASAREFILLQLGARKARVMVVDGKRRYALEE